MKMSTLALALGFATLGPLVAHADTPAPSAMSPAQVTAMHAKLNQAEQLVASINQSYDTQFAIGPKTAMMAMQHMARANMEMAKAMMDMQEMWGHAPSPYPTGENGQ
jgi:hypothetical protein